jgi:PKD repeat protein
MKKIILIFFIIAGFLEAGPAFSLTVYISGTVKYSPSMVPVQYHTVTIQDTSGQAFPYFNSVVTDTNGYYADTIYNVPAGTIFIVGTLDCNNTFLSQYVNSNSSPATVNFVICAGTPPATLTVSLAGSVSDLANGSPVTGHPVTIKDTASGSYTFFTTVLTDTNGFFFKTIPNVPVNSWFAVSTRDCNNIRNVMVANGNQGTGFFDFRICVNPPPPPPICHADFTYDSINVLTCQFNDQSTADTAIISWAWDFGDGTPILLAQNPVHIFPNAGNYNVCLTITSKTGCQDTTCRQVTVVSPPPPLFTQVITGRVTNDVNGAPVPNHEVNVACPSLTYASSVHTNSQGYYADSVPNVPATGMHVSITTRDCNAQLISDSITTSASPATVNFVICVAAGECVAAFTYDSLAPLSCHFVDLSIPADTIASWSWNFGDPASGSSNTSAVQNPDHIFSATGIFTVCLTITSADSLHPCSADTCMTIQVTQPATCHADFRAENDTGSQLPGSYKFFDLSTGQHDLWTWTFGDGSGSDLQNPDHTYALPGSYNVCLTISTSNTSQPCTDDTCMTVFIAPPVACSAGFQAILDTLSPVSRSYAFLDQSTGEPDHWHWSFGDGSTSELQNPLHRFDSSGSFQVCLRISKNDSTGTVVCSDTTCTSIVIPQYFKLGGHVFAGRYPINNPQSTGDTGIAWLYRLNSGAPVLFDTNVFTYLGYYTFPELLPGDYLVKAELSQGSVHAAGYLPTYYPEALTSGEAGIIHFTGDNFAATIHLHAIQSKIGEFDGSQEIIFGDLYPNPCSGTTHLLINSMIDLTFTAEVFSMTGQQVSTCNYSIKKGISRIGIVIPGGRKGMFFLGFRGEDRELIRTGIIMVE